MGDVRHIFNDGYNSLIRLVRQGVRARLGSIGRAEADDDAVPLDQLMALITGGGSGSSWTAGAGAPSGTASDGELYLNTSNGDVYQYVDPTGWGSPIMNLVGSDGIDGTNGTKLYSGSGDPSSGLGSIGDYYINQDSSNYFYEKVGSTVWVALFPLQGVQGNPGIGVMIIQMIYHGSSEISGVTVPDNSWIQINTI